jgi:hypothetical protein
MYAVLCIMYDKMSALLPSIIHIRIAFSPVVRHEAFSPVVRREAGLKSFCYWAWASSKPNLLQRQGKDGRYHFQNIR